MHEGSSAIITNHNIPLDSAEKLLKHINDWNSKFIDVGQGPGVDTQNSLITHIIQSVSRKSPALGLGWWILKLTVTLGSMSVSLCLSFFSQKTSLLIVPKTWRYLKDYMVKLEVIRPNEERVVKKRTYMPQRKWQAKISHKETLRNISLH